MTRTVLRGSALFHLALGVCLLVATWERLYDTLRIPDPNPAIYAQLAGAFSIGFAYVLGRAARDPTAARTTVAGTALADALGAGVVAAWIVSGQVRGGAELTLLGFVLTAFAAAQLAAVHVSRRTPA